MVLQLCLKPIHQVLRHYLFNADAILPCQGIILTISFVIHIMRSNVAANLMVLIPEFKFLSLWIFLVFEADRVVRQPTLLLSYYPLALAVLLTPILILSNSLSLLLSLSLILASTASHLLASRSSCSILLFSISCCLLNSSISRVFLSSTEKSFWKRSKAG
jgi:hypothetical protein